MKISWNGHSSFTIVADNGTTIVTDPYEPGAFGGGIGYGAIKETPDIVTISHDHADHGYTAGFSGPFQEIRGNGKAKGIEFQGFNTFHDDDNGAQRGTNTILCFSVNNVRICHLGDIGHTLSDAEAKQIGAVDVLLIPVGGIYTIDADQATDIVNKLHPRITIPMHFKTAKCGFPIAEVSAFTKGKANVRENPSDQIDVSAGTLPVQPEIVALKHRL